MQAVEVFARPYVVSWNLTYRCNLACEHCYLDAGGKPLVEDEAFADRSELTTAQCFKVVDDIAAFAPEAVTILTGGEPLLRRDILEIIRYASSRGLWVVVGTNGVKITPTLAALLVKEGVRGLSLSLDALDEDRHDRFRRARLGDPRGRADARFRPVVARTRAGRGPALRRGLRRRARRPRDRLPIVPPLVAQRP